MKAEEIKKLEKMLKALANRRRLEIIAYIKKNQKVSVGNIANAIRLSFRSTSRHFAILRSIDILEREASGLAVLYSLSTINDSTIKVILHRL